MYFNKFDICEAYYLFAAHYHGGQFSKEYRIFGRLNKIKFEPSPSLSVRTLSENGLSIYNNLVRTVGNMPADYEACSDCGFDHSYEQEEAISFHKNQE